MAMPILITAFASFSTLTISLVVVTTLALAATVLAVMTSRDGAAVSAQSLSLDPTSRR